MIKCDNLNERQMSNAKVFVIWADVRKSSELNNYFNDEQLHDMYAKSLNTIDKILFDNGFENKDIQGDGIYGVSIKENPESIINAIKEINNALIEEIEDPNGDPLMTISAHYGNEVFACFGSMASQMAFFGGVVSESKKWISNSIWDDNKKTRLILSKEAADKIMLQKNKELMLGLNISLKGNKNKKFRGYYN